MNRVAKFLRLMIFPLMGIGIFYFLFKDRAFDELAQSIRNDFDYRVIGLSLLVGIASHWIRAIRWRMLLEFEGRKPQRIQVFGAVWIGYLANLILPRMGEVTKCGVISRYSKISFASVAGTVVVERLADLIGLLVIFIAVWFLEYSLIMEFVARYIQLPAINGNWLLYLGLFLGTILLIWVAYRFLFRKLRSKFQVVAEKFVEGIRSFAKLRQKFLFVVYSALIWVTYFFMLYIPFFSLADTSSLSPIAAFTVLITGSLGMLVPIQGGIGPWHFMVIQTLVLYGVATEAAGNFALVVHSSQNLLIVVVGLFFFLMLPFWNRKPKA